MSWAGGNFDFSLNTSERDMQKEIEKVLGRERGYHEPAFLTMLLLKSEPAVDGYEAAEKRLSELYPKYGRKYNYGIKYIDHSADKHSKKFTDLQKRISELDAKSAAYAEEHSVLKFKAEFVGCPSCKSKLSRVHLKSDKCPLCRTDMRSDTTLSTLDRYAQRIKDLKKQLDAETKKDMEKNKGEVRWLISAEAYLG